MVGSAGGLSFEAAAAAISLASPRFAERSLKERGLWLHCRL
jgi:hypothetical protein